MAFSGDFQTCLTKLINQMRSKKGVQYVLIQEAVSQSYILYDFEDPNLDWSKTISGKIRVVLCVSRSELTLLQNLLGIVSKI